MVTKISSSPILGDVIKFVAHPAYCYESRLFKNTSGVALVGVNITCQPVKIVAGNWVPVLAGDEANATGLVANQLRVDMAINEVSKLKVLALVRGMALVLLKDLVNDVVGDPFDADDLETALEALSPPIIRVFPPMNVEEMPI